MTILRPFLLPTAGIPENIKAPERSRSMLEEEFYKKRSPKTRPKVQTWDSEESKIDQLNQGFTTKPVTGDYLAEQLSKMGNRTPPPKLDPGARAKMPDTSSVSGENFRPYYEQLKTIAQIGQEQVGQASAIAAFRRLQALNSLGNSGGGGGAAPPTSSAGQSKFTGSGNVGGWINQAAGLLSQLAGINLTDQDKAWVATMIHHESGGNPNIVNNWDSNAKKGTPSKGLMQTIDPTFNSHKLPGYNNIYDPIHNIIAGVRYAIKRYGSIANVPGIRNLRNGRGYVGY